MLFKTKLKVLYDKVVKEQTDINKNLYSVYQMLLQYLQDKIKTFRNYVTINVLFAKKI